MNNTFSKIYNLLPIVERRKALVLLIFMIIGMLFEIIGIGLIIPVITLMMQADLASSFPAFASLINFFGKPSQSEIITVVMLSLVCVYVIKNLFLAFLIWTQTHFAFDVQTKLSQQLFEIYLHQPYTFHLQRNSAQLIRNITSEVSLFKAALTSSLLLVGELLVLVGITFLLVLVEPFGALIVFLVLGGAAWGFHRITRQHISRWGVERQHHDGLRIQHLQQGLGGAKDVKLLGRENEFLKQFQTHSRNSARVWKLHTILQNYPRLMFELLAVTGLAILVISMIMQEREMMSIIPTLGLFAAAAFRLMPSVNRILGSVQALRYSLPVVNTLGDEFELGNQVPTSQKVSNLEVLKNNLCLTNLQYYYPGTNLPALNGISIKIEKGETVGVIGASGSGKSTLVDVILGLLTPSAGLVEIDGNDIQLALRQWQDQIGYVPQSIYLTDDTLRRNIAFGLPNKEIDDVAIKRAIHAAQLEEFTSSLAEGVETIVGERGIRLSGGQRQRIGIARALYHDPDVLVLDEATSALDTETEMGVMKAIMALHGEKTIIIVAHRLSTVEHCDRLYKFEQGRVVDEGVPAEVIPSTKISTSI